MDGTGSAVTRLGVNLAVGHDWLIGVEQCRSSWELVGKQQAHRRKIASVDGIGSSPRIECLVVEARIKLNFIEGAPTGRVALHHVGSCYSNTGTVAIVELDGCVFNVVCPRALRSCALENYESPPSLKGIITYLHCNPRLIDRAS
ncbi:hypothetical protein NL676_012624 [Syzygium grande]|nr:hypothetical protein NL676_012624 [Syzygium grande]